MTDAQTSFYPVNSGNKGLAMIEDCMIGQEKEGGQTTDGLFGITYWLTISGSSPEPFDDVKLPTKLEVGPM